MLLVAVSPKDFLRHESLRKKTSQRSKAFVLVGAEELSPGATVIDVVTSKFSKVLVRFLFLMQLVMFKTEILLRIT